MLAAMQIIDEQIENFRRRLEVEHGEVLSFGEAKGRYLAFLELFWLLAHEPPKEGEPPYRPPPPPWQSPHARDQ
jgi:hypothetical protein